jgi:hypothetical protein
MSYKTSFWEEDLSWNGVIYPTENEDVKRVRRNYNPTDVVICEKAEMKKFEDDVRCFLSDKVDQSKAKMADAIKQIDEIRKVDVPVPLYLFLYFLGMVLAFGLSYIMLAVLRLYYVLAIICVVFLVVSITFAMGYITYRGFCEEEERDAGELADLYNTIKRERGQQLNYIRQDLKVKALNQSRTDTEYNASFLHHYNSMKLQSLRLYEVLQIENQAEKDREVELILCNMQEIVFHNPVFMKRLLDNLIEPADASNMEVFIPELFSVWLPLFFFRECVTANDVSSLCWNNLVELQNRAKAFLNNRTIMEKVCRKLLVQADQADCFQGFCKGGNLSNMPNVDKLPDSLKQQ